jgi:hypothetical protein
MALFPRLPFHSDETPASWACRLAAFHTGGGLKRFLEDQGISIYALMASKEEAIDRLAKAGGEEPDRLLSNALIPISKQELSIRGFTVFRRFATRTDIRACPHCLHDDMQAGEGDPRWFWRGRLIWTLRTTRVCPIHRCEVVKIGSAKSRADYYNMAPFLIDGRLNTLTKDAVQREATPKLQDWVLARIEGCDSGDWLCGQALYQAVRACEMLGVVRAFGPMPNLRNFTDHDWERAGEAGFEVAIEGEGAIRDALTEIARRSRSGQNGPQAVYGRLYQWLEFQKSGGDRGPIRDLLRDHIINTMPIGAGEAIFGEPVVRRRVHSVRSLSEASGLHPKRLRKAVFALGLADETLKGASANRITLDADAGDDLVRHLLDPITQRELPEYLNCSRSHALTLDRAGVLQALITRDRLHQLGTKAFSRTKLDGFMQSVLDRAAPVDVADDNVFDLSTTVKRAMTDTATVVRLIQTGKIRRVQRLMSERGLASLRIDPDEVRRVLYPDWERRDLGISQAAKMLRLQEKVVIELIRPGFGEPFLPSRQTEPDRYQQSIWIRREDIEAFRSDYVSLPNLGREIGLYHTKALALLEKESIEPVGDWRRIGIRIYRRADVGEILGRARIEGALSRGMTA